MFERIEVAIILHTVIVVEVLISKHSVIVGLAPSIPCTSIGKARKNYRVGIATLGISEIILAAACIVVDMYRLVVCLIKCCTWHTEGKTSYQIPWHYQNH